MAVGFVIIARRYQPRGLDARRRAPDRGDMKPIGSIALSEIQAARTRIAGTAVHTPLIPLDLGAPPSSTGKAEVWLKLECLQPIGSFKIRGAANAMARVDPERLVDGVYTASAGNMAQGVAFAARRLGLTCRVIVPDSAPRTKIDAIRRLGGTVVPLPYDEWWDVIRSHGHPDERGFFIHPVSDPDVIAGNGTIGLEILEELPDVDRVFVPYGGGGLSCGIASALRPTRPELDILATEVDTAAPLTASLEAGAPRTVERTPSFVDGIGGNSVLPEMWPLASSLLSGSRVVSLPSVCGAIRLLAERAHVVAEGAGGSAVAAALQHVDRLGSARGERVVAVVSGGNIDTADLAVILQGGVPDRMPTRRRASS
jgi:threonine dehydratase